MKNCRAMLADCRLATAALSLLGLTNGAAVTRFDALQPGTNQGAVDTNGTLRPNGQAFGNGGLNGTQGTDGAAADGRSHAPSQGGASGSGNVAIATASAGSAASLALQHTAGDSLFFQGGNATTTVSVTSDGGWSIEPRAVYSGHGTLYVVYQHGVGAVESALSTLNFAEVSATGRKLSDVVVATNAALECNNGELLKTSTGALLAFWNLWDYRVSTSGLSIYVSRSTDQGVTWSAPAICATNPTPRGKDLNAHGRGVQVGGMLIKPFCAYGGAWQTVSRDDGLTWSAPALMVPAHAAAFFEPSLCVARNGSILAALWGMHAGQAAQSTNYLCVTTDGGATWSAPRPTFAAKSLIDLVQLQNGSLLASYRPQSASALVFRTSSDAGATWSAETTVDANMMYGRYSSAVEVQSNRVALLYGAQNSSTTADLRMQYGGSGDRPPPGGVRGGAAGATALLNSNPCPGPAALPGATNGAAGNGNQGALSTGGAQHPAYYTSGWSMSPVAPHHLCMAATATNASKTSSCHLGVPGTNMSWGCTLLWDGAESNGAAVCITVLLYEVTTNHTEVARYLTMTNWAAAGLYNNITNNVAATQGVPLAFTWTPTNIAVSETVVINIQANGSFGGVNRNKAVQLTAPWCRSR